MIHRFIPSSMKRYLARKLSAMSIHHQAAKTDIKGDLGPDWIIISISTCTRRKKESEKN